MTGDLDLSGWGGCDCWRSNSALGHEGHCCFLRDDRNRRINGGWKTDAEVCQLLDSHTHNQGLVTGS